MALPEITFGDATDFMKLEEKSFPLYLVLMHFQKAGDEQPKHIHGAGHFTALLKGRARFLVNGEEAEKTAPCLVWTNAQDLHQITALEDDTLAACIMDKRAFL